MPDRLTIVSTIYHQQGQLEATAEDFRYERELRSEEEQPYKRIRLKVGEEWQPLFPKGCWLTSVSIVLIENHAGQGLQLNPTEDEKKAISQQWLEVRQVGDRGSWLIPPGEPFYGNPSCSVDQLEIRCRSGETRYTPTAFPG